MRWREVRVGAAVLLVLAALWWLVQDGRRETASACPEARSPSAAGTGDLASSPLLAAGAGLEAAGDPEREAAAGAVATTSPPLRARIHGRLVMEESGAPLDEALRLRLRAGDLSVIETLVSSPDGTFVTASEFPRHRVMVKVFRPAGDEAVDHEGYFDPAADEVLVVPVPWPTFVHGTLVDAGGAALVGVAVQLSRGSDEHGSDEHGADEHGADEHGADEHGADEHGADERAADEAEALRTRTKEGGEFWLEGASAGRRTLLVARGIERASFALHLGRGPNELGELHASFVTLAGAIAGRLIAADGEPAAALLLSEPRLGLVACTDSEADEAGDGVSSFAFEGLPRGEYRLEILSEDGRRYEPAALRVSPPASELEFRAVGVAEPFTYTIGDAAEEDLGGCALVRMRGQWLDGWDEIARADVERWILLAPRHRPLCGERPPAGALRARLEPGFGHAYLFSELGDGLAFAQHDGVRGRPLAGVEVVADGRTVASSDADGLALVSLAAPPLTLSYHLAGWQLGARYENGERSLVALQREDGD